MTCTGKWFHCCVSQLAKALCASVACHAPCIHFQTFKVLVGRTPSDHADERMLFLQAQQDREKQVLQTFAACALALDIWGIAVFGYDCGSVMDLLFLCCPEVR